MATNESDRPGTGIAGFDSSATKPPFVAVASASSETVLQRFPIWLFWFRAMFTMAGITVQLIGMLDSPYVRRVAISLQLLGLRFEHRSISVFRTFEQFRQINPVVKAPSLVCDDGEVLMDSTLIIEFAEALVGGRRSLMPNTLAERQHALRQVGLALAACEKSVAIIYERNLRPPEKLHEPWVSRVTGQLLSAYQLLELELSSRPPTVTSAAINQAGLSIAVAWHFTQQMIPDVVAASRFPILGAFSEAAERLPEFLAAPHGDSTLSR